jgi:hypothetical protein
MPLKRWLLPTKLHSHIPDVTDNKSHSILIITRTYEYIHICFLCTTTFRTDLWPNSSSYMNLNLEECCLLGYDTMESLESYPTFQWNISLPSAGSKTKLSMKPP